MNLTHRMRFKSTFQGFFSSKISKLNRGIMSRKFLNVFLFLILSPGILLDCSSKTSEFNIYVSPDGDDNNPGTLPEPLQTFKAASGKIRSLLDDYSDITVYFRKGYYFFDETVIIGKNDFSEKVNITYAAYKDEKPPTESGMNLIVWLKMTAENKIAFSFNR